VPSVVVVLLLIISSCGGGGGGGGSSGGSATIYGNPNWVSSASTTDINAYKTTEYNAQWGLGTIKAAEAYALLAANSKTVAGSEVKIGIVDTGVQTNHVEIANNYSATGSHDYVNNDSDPSDDNGHGTHVASIAAGVKNDSGMHGVAYQATILAEKALNSSSAGSSSAVASGVSNAVSNGAKVINLSLGGSSGDSDLQSAMTTAKDSNALVVAATGNDGASQPNYPAYYAADSGLAGYVLAVGAVDSSGTLASFSNYCGDTKSYCLVAPGVSIYAAYPTSTYNTLSGTSMATPHVAGAAAVISGAWTFLTAPKTAQILLTSANRSFSGYDETKHGQGILDLEAAVKAQGQNTLGYGVSVASGAGYDLASTSLASSAIFGDAFSHNVAPQVSSAIFYDDYGRDYKASLDQKIISNIPRQSFNNISSKSVPLSFAGNQLRFNLATQKTLDRSQDPQSRTNSGFSLVKSFSNSHLGFAFNIDEKSLSRGNSGFLLQNNFAANPYQSFFAGHSFNQIFFNRDLLQKKLALSFSYQAAQNQGVRQNQLLDVGASFKNISLSFGNLTEFQNNILNSKSLGAFESPGDVKTSYLKISLNQKLTKDLSFLANLAEGQTSINGNARGIFRDFADVRSRSFSLALLWKGFGVSYAEPMRVYRGKVAFDIPVARDDAGNLYRYRGTASLAPKGRERDYEFFYTHLLSDSASLKISLLTQRQMNNIKAQPTNYFGLVSISRRW